VLDIHGFLDEDRDGDLDCRRSTRGYVFNQLDEQKTICSGTFNYIR
jgi:hypothetical protein